MYLKKLKLKNYRKFYEEQNEIEFVSSKIKQGKSEKEEDTSIEENKNENLSEEDRDAKIDIASDTTLIIGKNNAGKTTIISALEKLIKKPNSLGVNDFNFRYLKNYLDNYGLQSVPDKSPYIEFGITVELEEKSDDRISNLIPFMLVEDLKDTELDICIRYEVKDELTFHARMKEFKSDTQNMNSFEKFLKLLKETDFTLNYYDKNDKNKEKMETDFKLSNLMDIECIKANHLKSEYCLSEAFNRIISYRYKHNKEQRKEIESELEGMNVKLSEDINKNHTDVVKEVMSKMVSTNYMEVDLSADITFEKLMTNLIRYQYIENKVKVPEDQFGLGYSNLVMIIAKIMDYIEQYPDTVFNSKINLISIEEPETFMHPQMQELFIRNINEALDKLLSSNQKNINSQIIITTHSSHILNSKIHSSNTFNNICYLYEKGHHAAVTNLNNEKVVPKKESIEDKETFRFLKKHIKYKVSELFFSDAAIFVEGFAEDLLIPYYLENREEKLGKYYISVFNINGAHGYLYRSLVEALGIPVLIITDLDIKREKMKNEGGEKSEEKDTSQITSLDQRETTNKTIENFHGKKDISDIHENIIIDNVYLSYQGNIGGYYATSFEEAFILTNFDNKILNKVLTELKPDIYKKIVTKENNYEENKNNSYLWQDKLGKVKGEFASKLLYKIVNEECKNYIPKLPKYIADGLTWLEKKLGGE